MADAILKLEDEVVKLIKVIGSALLKEATADDLAVISQQSNAGNGGNNDNNSEFARLQRLPGFSRMQRQLFFNMMTARPDISDSNIRIQNIKPAKKSLGATMKIKKASQQQVAEASPNASDTTSEKNNQGNRDAFQLEEEDVEPTMGRSTIKNISKLIIERDAAKIKPPNPETTTSRR